MHILFIDESGGLPPPNKQGPRHFILGGLIIPEEIWPKLAADLKRIKKSYGVTGEIKWRYFIAGNNKPDNSLINLAPAQRDAMRLELFQAMARYKSLRIISIICDVQASYHNAMIVNEDGLYHRAYKVLTERFQYFLQDTERTNGLKINGLIVCDNRNSREDSRLQQFHQTLANRNATFTSNYGNMIEGLFIAPSHYSVGIQFADLVAGAIYRHVEASDARFFDIISPLIRTSPEGRLEGYGLVKIPKGASNA
jgi:hypothetical protein